MFGALTPSSAMRLCGRELSKNLIVALLLISGLTPAIGIHKLLVKFLFRQLPVEEPQRLFHFDDTQSYPTVRLLRERFRSQRGPVVDCLAWYSGIFNEPLSLRDSGGKQSEVGYDFVSGNGLGLLGVIPAIGCVLDEQDDEGPQGASIWSADLSYEYWTSKYARDPRILNTVITIHDTPVRIVGVLPDRFTGLMPGEHAEVFLPLPFLELLRRSSRRLPYLEDPNLRLVDVYGRTRGPWRLSSVQRYLNGIAGSILRQTGFSGPNSVGGAAQLRISSGEYGHSWLRETYRAPLIVLDLLAASLMILSGTAIYGLTMLSHVSREKNLAIKIALGASKRRLLLHESSGAAIVVVLSAALSFVLASCLTKLVAQPFVEALSRRQSFDVTYGVSSVTLPALLALVLSLTITMMTAHAIRRAGGTISSGFRTSANEAPHANRRAGAVVFAQMAMASLLVASCAVLTLNLNELLSIDPGLSLRQLVHIVVERKAETASHGTRSPSGFSESPNQLATRLLKQARSIPLLGSISATAQYPFSGQADTASVLEGGTTHHVYQASLDLLQVSPGFFQSLSVPLLAGREFHWDDRQSCMLDGLAARRLYPGSSALGKTLAYRLDDTAPYETCTVIGVSRAVALSDIRRPQAASLILPYPAAADISFPLHILVRNNDIHGELIPRMTQELAALDKGLSIARTEDLGQKVDESFGRERVMAILSAVFCVCALLVAGAGLFSSLSCQIKLRTAEFGIRMALGADHARLAQPLVKQAATLCLPAVMLEVGLAAWMSQNVASFLFDPRLSKPWVPVASGVLMLGFALTCVALAVGRILRLDPSGALRAP